MEKEPVGTATMPGIGFGTLGNVGDAGSALVEAALAEGYRHIDTSRYYVPAFSAPTCRKTCAFWG